MDAGAYARIEKGQTIHCVQSEKREDEDKRNGIRKETKGKAIMKS